MTKPNDPITDSIISVNHGLTKRELFAALAMQGILASGDYDSFGTASIYEASVYYADALINELNKEGAK